MLKTKINKTEKMLEKQKSYITTGRRMNRTWKAMSRKKIRVFPSNPSHRSESVSSSGDAATLSGAENVHRLNSTRTLYGPPDLRCVFFLGSEFSRASDWTRGAGLSSGEWMRMRGGKCILARVAFSISTYFVRNETAPLIETYAF